MTSIGSISSSTTSSYVSRYDTNGDGVVSADELAAATASTSSSTSLLSTTSEDDGSTGNAAASQLSSLMMSIILQASGGETQSGQSDGETPAQMMFSSLDTDGDGTISAAEFAAGAPEGVSDDMSAKLFSSLDTDGDGSITESELAAARHGPPHAPPADTDATSDTDATASTDDTSSSDDTSSTDDQTSMEALLAKLEEIAQQYLSSSSDDVDTTSALLTTV